MAIPAESTYAALSGHTGTGPVTFGFYYSSKDDLTVYVTEPGVPFTPDDALGSGGFTVSNGSAVPAGYDGGSVTLVSSVANKDVYVVRNWEQTRSTDLSDAGYDADDLNGEFDSLIGMIQDVSRKADRAALAPLGESFLTFPTVAVRANKFLLFGESGELTASSGVSSVPVSSYMEPLLLSTSATALLSAIDWVNPASGGQERTVNSKLSDLIREADFDTAANAAAAAYGLLFLMESDLTITVASSGGDFTTLRAALDAVAYWLIADDATLTISLAAETFVSSTQIYVDHPFASRILIDGVSASVAAPTSVSITSNGAGDHDATYTTGSAHGLAVDDWVRFTGLSGANDVGALEGLWKVTATPTSTTFTVNVTAQQADISTSTVTDGTIRHLQTVLEFNGSSIADSDRNPYPVDHGCIEVNCRGMRLQDVGVVFTGSDADVQLFMLRHDSWIRCLSNVAGNGATKIGVWAVYNSVFEHSGFVVSNCAAQGMVAQLHGTIEGSSAVSTGHVGAAIRAREAGLFVSSGLHAAGSLQGVSAEGRARVSAASATIVSNTDDGAAADSFAYLQLSSATISSNGVWGIDVQEGAVVDWAGATVAANGTGARRAQTGAVFQGTPTSVSGTETISANCLDDAYFKSLHARSASSGATPSVNADECFIEGSANSGITIGSGASSTGSLFFSDSGGDDGGFEYLHGTNTLRIRAANGTRWTVDNTALLPGLDDTYEIGSASKRVEEYFGAVGSINTSDQNEKTALRAPTAAEIAVAGRIIDQMGFYQWLSAVDEKGEDGARLHFGTTSQIVRDAFIAEGLDPARYGMWCRDALVETVDVEVEVERQATMSVEVQVEVRERVGDQIVQRFETRTRDEPVYDVLPLVDEDGSPVLDDNGHPVTMSAPRMETVTEMRPAEIALLDENGDPVYRLGLRPDQLGLFLMHCALARAE